jgi:hypothetical protein
MTWISGTGTMDIDGIVNLGARQLCNESVSSKAKVKRYAYLLKLCKSAQILKCILPAWLLEGYIFHWLSRS